MTSSSTKYERAESERSKYPVRLYSGRALNESAVSTQLPKISASKQRDDVYNRDALSRQRKKLPEISKLPGQRQQEIHLLSQTQEKSRKLPQNEIPKHNNVVIELRKDADHVPLPGYVTRPNKIRRPTSVQHPVEKSTTPDQHCYKDKTNENNKSPEMMIGRNKIKERKSEEASSQRQCFHPSRDVSFCVSDKEQSTINFQKNSTAKSCNRVNVTSGFASYRPISKRSDSNFNNVTKPSVTKRCNANIPMFDNNKSSSNSAISPKNHTFSIVTKPQLRSKTTGNPGRRDKLETHTRRVKSCRFVRSNEAGTDQLTNYDEEPFVIKYNKMVDVYMDVAWQRARRNRVQQVMQEIKIKSELEKINENRRRTLQSRNSVKRQREQLLYVRNKHLEEKEKRLASQHVKWKFVKKTTEDRSIYGLPNYIQKHR